MARRRAHKQPEPLPQVPQILRDFVLNNTSDPMLVAVGSTVVEANDALVRLFGYQSRDEMIGLSFSALATPESVRIAEERLGQRASRQEPAKTQLYTAVHKSGEQFLAESSAISWPQEPTVTIALVRDVTERRRQFEVLRESEQLYRTLAETMPAGVLFEDASGQVLYANEQMTRLTGYSVDELKSGVWLIDPQDSITQALYWEALTENTSRIDYQASLIRKDGTPFWASISWRPIQARRGTPQGTVTTFVDVTERRRTECALRESEERFRSLVASIPGAVLRLIADEERTIDFMSDGVESITGYPSSHFVGRPISAYLEIVHPEDRDDLAERGRAALDERRPYLVEYRIVHRDGSIRACRGRGQGVYDGTGRLRHIDSVIFDITEQYLAAEALRESEERYKSIVENTRDLIILAKPDGTGIYLSPACKEMLGYEPEELAGNVLRMVHPDDVERAKQRRAEGYAGRRGADFEYRVITKSGEVKWVSHSWSPIVRDGKVQTVVSVVRDITERRLAEDRLREAHAELEKAYQVQREFLNNVTHEIRTPMTAVKGYVEMLLEGIAGPLNEDQAALLRKVLAGSDSLVDLVTSLLEVARLKTGRVTLRPKACKPGAIAEKAISAVVPQAAKKGLTIDLRVLGQDRMAVYDEEKVVIILNNLLSNAVKFTSRGKVGLHVRSGHSGVEMVVTDTGRGIPQKDLASIFDQFQQLDHPGQRKPAGFGLGLAIVANMVTVLGATLVVSSRAGVGTAFTLSIPKIEARNA